MPYIEQTSPPSSALFDLVKSLNSSEKRYFKLLASLQKGEKNYLRLFDAIDVQPEHDEESLKKQFHDEPFARQLHVARNYLYNLILKSLRSYHAQLSPEMRLRDMLADARILYERGLAHQCRQMLDKGKKLAEEHERETDLLEIISLYDRWFKSSQNSDIGAEMLFEQRREILHRLENRYEYDLLSDKISRVVIGSGKARTEETKANLEALLNHHLLQDETHALSQSALLTQYYIRSAVYYATGDTEGALCWTEKRLHVIGEEPEQIAAKPYSYTGILINLLTLHKGNDQEKFNHCLEKLRALPDLLAAEGFRSPLFSYWVFNNVAGLELSNLLTLGKFSEAARSLPAIHDTLKETGRLVRQVDTLRFNFLTAYIYFGTKDFRKALCYIHKVLETPRDTPRQDMLYTARLIELLIYFELGEHPLFDYKLQALQRFLSRRGRLFAFEGILLKALRQLPECTHRDMTREWFRNLYDKLAPLRSDRLEANAFDHFNYLAWLRSKIDGVSFAEGINREKEEMIEQLGEE